MKAIEIGLHVESGASNQTTVVLSQGTLRWHMLCQKSRRCRLSSEMVLSRLCDCQNPILDPTFSAAILMNYAHPAFLIDDNMPHSSSACFHK